MPLGYWDPDANDGAGCYRDGGAGDVCTPLDENGTGVYNTFYYSNGELGFGFYDSTYWIMGVATPLDSSGSGTWNGEAYYNGSTQPTGWNGYYYYIDNVETNLSDTGMGTWGGLYYEGGQPFTGLGPNGVYFISGATTSLDSAGSGFWSGEAYYNGSTQPTGWNGYYYYIDNVQTTLDDSGTGTWNGEQYSGGNILLVGVTFVGGDFSDVSNWRSSSGATANQLPDTGDDIIISGTVTASPNWNPVFGTVLVTNTGAIETGFSVTNITFAGESYFNGNSGADYLFVSGTATFQDQSYIVGGVISGGTTVFRNRATNRNLLEGTTVVSAHGGGINGSNILGIA